MSPRRSAAEARDTREAIVERAVDLASTDGLEGVTIGRLAADLRMSKAGVLGHFGTKQALQLSALEAAMDVFRAAVWDSTARAKPGLRRLHAVTDAWISFYERGVFPGGCFMTAAACEYDGRDGPVRDAVARALSEWQRALESHARRAIDDGDLSVDADPAAIAFQLNALAMGVNQALQLFGDPRAPRQARNAMRAVLSG